MEPLTRFHGGRVVVLAGGEPEPAEFVRALVRDDDLLIAANGGGKLALSAGLHPRLLVGDMDSIDAAVREALATEVLQHPCEKNESDLELALQCALQVSPSEVIVLGALGGRLDHLLTNVGLLHWGRRHNIPMRLVSARGSAFLADSKTTLDAPIGSLVSLVPLTEVVDGITLSGLRYPLHDETLPWGTSRGLSNEVVSPPVVITVGRGLLLVVTLT